MSEHIEEHHVDSETEAESTPQPMGGHPLFPRPDTETGPDTRRIDLIHIERYTENGREACPTPFLASELRSWNDVISRFGGGTYMARAMCGKTFRFQGNTEKMTFHSPPSRPFTDSPVPPKAVREEEPRPAPAPPPPPAPTPAMPTLMPIFTPAATPPSQPGNTNQLDVGAVILAMLNRPTPPPMDLAPLIGPLVAAATRPAPPPPPPPPPPPQGPDMMPLMAAFLQSNAEMMRAMLQAQSKPAPAPPDMLTILRELKPVLSNAGGDNASLLLQGVEIAKGLFQASATSATPAAAVQPDDLGQILGALTKVMASSSSSSSTPPPAEPAAPRAAPPSTPWAWARTPEGAVVPVAIQGSAPAAFAAPQTVLASAPPPPVVDLDRKISEVLEGPVMRERLQGVVAGALRTLLAPPARVSVPQPVRPAPHLRVVPPPVAAQAVPLEPEASMPQEILLRDVDAGAASSTSAPAVAEVAAPTEAEAPLVTSEAPRDVATAASPLAAYSSERFPLEEPEVLSSRVNDAMSVLERAMREEGPDAAFASAQGLLESPDFVAALVTVAPEMAEHLAQLGGEQARGLFEQVKRDLVAATAPSTEPATVG